MNLIPLFFSPTLCSRNSQGPDHVVDLLHNPLHATTIIIIILLPPWLIFFHKWSSWIIDLINCKLHLNWIYSQHNIWTGWGWFPVQLHLFYLLIMLSALFIHIWFIFAANKMETENNTTRMCLCAATSCGLLEAFTHWLFNWMSHLWRWLRCVYTWIYLLLCLRG